MRYLNNAIGLLSHEETPRFLLDIFLHLTGVVDNPDRSQELIISGIDQDDFAVSANRKF